MIGGSRLLATAAVVALAGCGETDAQLEIRSIPAPLSATSKPMPYRIAEAHGHLALGNVALAIESFRKALREQPESVEAMVGLATAYDQMARFDLSRRYYESALAIVPADTRVLTAFARSLDAQGQSVEAAAVRGEIRVRSAAAAPRPAPVIQAPVPARALAQVVPPVVGPSVTIKLPPARPAAVVAVKRPAPKAPAIVLPAKPEPKIAAAVLPVAPTPVVAAPKPAQPKAFAPAPVAPIAVARKAEPIKPPASFVAALKPAEAKPIAPPPPIVAAKPAEPKAVALPLRTAPVAAPAKPVEVKVAAAPVVVVSKPVVVASKPVVVASKPVVVVSKLVEPKAAPLPLRTAPVAASRKPVELAAAPPLPAPAPMPVIVNPAEARLAPLPPAPEPVEIAQTTPASLIPETPVGQRLERLSLGEVALITTAEPKWRPMVVSKTAQSTTVRFVPLRSANAAPVRIRLLNAARHEGLAARTRRLLAQRGWRQLAIGNANRVRQSSLVLYPANQRRLAKRLAAQFGIALAKHASGTDVVVLLGRDSTRRNPVVRVS